MTHTWQSNDPAYPVTIPREQAPNHPLLSLALSILRQTQVGPAVRGRRPNPIPSIGRNERDTILSRPPMSLRRRPTRTLHRQSTVFLTEAGCSSEFRPAGTRSMLPKPDRCFLSSLDSDAECRPAECLPHLATQIQRCRSHAERLP